MSFEETTQQETKVTTHYWGYRELELHELAFVGGGDDGDGDSGGSGDSGSSSDSGSDGYSDGYDGYSECNTDATDASVSVNSAAEDESGWTVAQADAMEAAVTESQQASLGCNLAGLAVQGIVTSISRNGTAGAYFGAVATEICERLTAEAPVETPSTPTTTVTLNDNYSDYYNYG